LNGQNNGKARARLQASAGLFVCGGGSAQRAPQTKGKETSDKNQADEAQNDGFLWQSPTGYIKLLVLSAKIMNFW
jgi:hypothetical protein